jgi:hypothetical protein
LQKDLKLDQFTNKNIAENLTVNWQNVNKIEKDSAEIYEIEINQKNKIKLESKIFREELKYKLIAVKDNNGLHAYLIEAFSSFNHDYPTVINDLKKFTGTLNVFELNGKNIGSIVVYNGKAKNPTGNNVLNPLKKAINLFYKPTNLTAKIPECNETSTAIVIDVVEDVYKVVSLQSTGKILGAYYLYTREIGSYVSYMAVPSGCDTAIDPFHHLERTVSYDRSFLEDQITYAELEPCPEEVMTQLMFGQTSKIVDILTKFNANFSKYNVTVKSGTILDGSAGNTSYTIPNSKFNYTITVSQDFTSGTKLFKASILLHELVHAHFMSIVDDYNASGNPPRNYDLNSFPSLFQAFCDKKYPPSGTTAANAHHSEMANQYVDAIASALQEYNTGIAVPFGIQPDQIYTDLAWGGLNNTPVFDSKFPIGNIERERILNRLGCEQVGRSVETGTPKQQNPVGKPCN